MQKNRKIYDSFEMYDLDGTFLCFCSIRKAKNYVVKKDLATWIDDNHQPIDNNDVVFINDYETAKHLIGAKLNSVGVAYPCFYSISANKIVKKFQLKFKSRAKTNPNEHFSTEKSSVKQFNDAYYQQKLENRCVCCGTTEYLTRHHVIPYMYRKHLHGKFKDNNHHDVLPICYECHRKYELEADVFKLELAYQYNIPQNLESIKTEVEVRNEQIMKARYIIKQFFNQEFGLENMPSSNNLLQLHKKNDKTNNATIPANRLEELTKIAVQKPIVLNPNSDDELEKYLLPRKTVGEMVLRQASSVTYLVNQIRSECKMLDNGNKNCNNSHISNNAKPMIRKKKSGESLENYMNYLYQHPNHNHSLIQKLIGLIEDEIYQFIFAWRNHFLEYAKPKYMPNHWDAYKKYD